MKKFKKALATTLAVLSAASALCMPVSASADTVTSYDSKYLSQNFGNNEASVYASSTEKTLSITGEQQEYTKWCWVACTKMVLNYFGVNKTQSEIYKKAKNTTTIDNTSGTSIEVRDTLNYYLSDLSFQSYNGSFATIKTKINVGSPVIIFGTATNSSQNSYGHAVLCYGYNSSNSSNLILYIIDPWTGNTGTMTCSSTSSKSYTMTLTDDEGTVTTYSYTSGALVYTTTIS